MIQNPILPGFHADPCICRKGNDFYIAVSSFEWFPGIPIYHSRDMKSWELYSMRFRMTGSRISESFQAQRVSGRVPDLL